MRIKRTQIRRTIIITLFLIAMLMMLTRADSGGRLHDPRVDNWYEVSDWELDVCTKWGGTGAAQSAVLEQEGETRVSQLEVTIQASKMNYTGNTLYEVAWYLKPMLGEEEYRIMLIGKDELELYAGSATSSAGSNGYDARHMNESYHAVRLEYDSGSMLVPIVQK